ncbi:hypothetical protein O1L60_42745 [Streptomyces diastatochromogenes]|nr:hypothetical protein [Streptomyces diastatochromogenes]
MTDAANTPPTARATRATPVIPIVAVAIAIAIGVAYMGLLAFISVPQLTDYIGGRDIDFPAFLAIAAVAGPALFWAYIALGCRQSAGVGPVLRILPETSALDPRRHAGAG